MLRARGPLNSTMISRWGTKIKRFKPIRRDAFYIIDIKRIERPLYIPKRFRTMTDAKQAIDFTLKGNHKRFHVITGRELIEDPMARVKKHEVDYNPQDVSKWNYPPELTTRRERKNFREKYNRLKRKKKN